MRARGKRGVGCERCVRAVSDLVGVVSNEGQPSGEWAVTEYLLRALDALRLENRVYMSSREGLSKILFWATGVRPCNRLPP